MRAPLALGCILASHVPPVNGWPLARLEKDMINRTTALASWVAIAGLCATSQAERPQTIPTAYYPSAGGVWERVRPVDAGWSSPALETLVEFVGQNKSTGLLVLDHGRVVAEHYWEVENPLLQNGVEYRMFRTGATVQGQPVEDDAAQYYEVERPGLGAAFISDVQRCTEAIVAHPDAAPTCSRPDPPNAPG